MRLRNARRRKQTFKTVIRARGQKKIITGSENHPILFTFSVPHTRLPLTKRFINLNLDVIVINSIGVRSI